MLRYCMEVRTDERSRFSIARLACKVWLSLRRRTFNSENFLHFMSISRAPTKGNIVVDESATHFYSKGNIDAN
eukprot:6182708-Pleurochrysis_carterae.AAC.2